MFNTNQTEAIERAEVLLKAVHDLLQKQEESPYVLNILAETIFYDEAECDGACLKEDIEYWFDEFSDISLSEDGTKERKGARKKW